MGLTFVAFKNSSGLSFGLSLRAKLATTGIENI